ncbi:hypothetical protein NSE_0657 [Neorickettsia sennetsu str. Miyayama]|uniref:Uncharacterized protein n=1 Tax=Ehrlichia sennetsu (strain ATCC VR-367 / Miyayama) TaxID=222891 RepID=Q2GDB1_EHRS3|nr:hypothetical protein NSE_0657 [Neorickettsia sennetsu str. Miyayama]
MEITPACASKNTAFRAIKQEKQLQIHQKNMDSGTL